MRVYAIFIDGRNINKPKEFHLRKGVSQELDQAHDVISRNKYEIYNDGYHYISGSLNSLSNKIDEWYSNERIRRDYNFL